ncbi:SIAE-like protein [Mya arenaria]|uniref:SIAE-like protein n=1 Tax=Mya arenaria TaxID=6604 RepID=A0ABY7EHJ4_MYAAR|nr:SIAE-like protein [Mya arenaria]
MVLQKGPSRSQLWGYADTVGVTVTAQVRPGGDPVHTKTVLHQGPGMVIWKVMLPAEDDVTSSESNVTINDVMFGDVWVCSGQSNMQFTLSMVNNFSSEIADAENYPDIRLMTVDQQWSATPKFDIEDIEENWTRPNKDAVGHSDWTYFSAVCWLYGKYLYQTLNRPIGLIASTWGGTPIEAWSSNDAMRVCNTTSTNHNSVHASIAPQDKPTQLWNAMIHPLLNMTIYGAIWYQGEANAGAPDSYACRFKAMIDDWRSKFEEASYGQTHAVFPFGFVQLAPNKNESSMVKGFPDIRWHQTYDEGYVPNTELPSVFMAVAADLPDFDSPFGRYSIPNPQHNLYVVNYLDVAHRLVLSALQVAYNNTSMGRYQGPKISAYFSDIGYHTLRLEFDHGEGLGVVVNMNYTGVGFEVCCSRNNQSKCDGTDSNWQPAPLKGSDKYGVTMGSCVDLWTMGVRYLWRESPCGFKNCPVYTKENDLPMAPFIVNGIL